MRRYGPHLLVFYLFFVSTKAFSTKSLVYRERVVGEWQENEQPQRHKTQITPKFVRKPFVVMGRWPLNTTNGFDLLKNEMKRQQDSVTTVTEYTTIGTTFSTLKWFKGGVTPPKDLAVDITKFCMDHVECVEKKWPARSRLKKITSAKTYIYIFYDKSQCLLTYHFVGDLG